MASFEGTMLETVDGFPQEILARLKASWITTAEEFVAATAATGGSKSMANLLKVGGREFQKALHLAEGVLPPGELARLTTPSNTEQRGLGVNMRDVMD